VLIAKGADVNAQGYHKSTALQFAAAWGTAEVVKLLLASGADLEAKSTDGRTPLHDAARWGRPDIAELLIVQRADPLAKDGTGATPLDLALAAGNAEIMKVLVSGRATVKQANGTALLHLAAAKGSKELAEALIADGADVDAKDNGGKTPLHVAAASGSRPVAEILLASGAKVKATDGHDMTPLHEAARRGHTEVAALLLAAGADVRAPGTEFYEGLGPRHKHPVRDFLAEVLTGVVMGKIAGAMTGGSPAPVGASPRARSVESAGTLAGVYLIPSTPPGVDITEGLEEIWDDGTWVYTDGTEAHWQKRTVAGITPLHLAAASGSLELMNLLLAAGADPKAKDSEGHTPAEVAASHGFPELAAALQARR
jgi:ankyrin repeat protein